MSLPTFRYHRDPIRSGSVVESPTTCRCCGKARGFVYAGPVYSEEDDLDDNLCPWCIADGSAAEKFDATFFDANAVADDVPEEALDEITTRTPGFDTWQSGEWPSCCGDATVFITPAGLAELRTEEGREYGWEGGVMNYIVYDMEISGSAATRLLDSLHKDKGPTAYIFHCPKCLKHHFFIDST